MPHRSIRATALALLALSGAAIAAAADAPASSKPAQRGLAFAETHCSGCHAVTANAYSPNPESPPFEAIANMPGLTSNTLQAFLRDSHNYPAAMNFTIERRQVRDLAAHILTLRRKGYHPPI